MKDCRDCKHYSDDVNPTYHNTSAKFCVNKTVNKLGDELISFCKPSKASEISWARKNVCIDGKYFEEREPSPVDAWD